MRKLPEGSTPRRAASSILASLTAIPSFSAHWRISRRTTSSCRNRRWSSGSRSTSRRRSSAFFSSADRRTNVSSSARVTASPLTRASTSPPGTFGEPGDSRKSSRAARPAHAPRRAGRRRIAARRRAGLPAGVLIGLELVRRADDRFKDGFRQEALQLDGEPLEEHPHRVAKRRGSLPQEPLHLPGDGFGTGSLLLVPLHDPEGGIELLAVRGGPLGLLRPDPVPREAGPVVAGLQERHPDPERPDFHPEGLREAFDRELGGAIERLEGNRDEARDRPHVHDEAGAALPHPGKDRLRHAEHSEEIGVELLLGLLEGGLFGRPGDPVARVVDEGVDPSL